MGRRMKKLMKRLPLGLLAAIMLGGAAAFFCLAMPAEMLERIVSASGLPDLLAAAAPPLGLTARLLAAALAALVAGGLAWGGFALSGPRRPAHQREGDADEAADIPLPPLRRADLHPDAPPRRPLFAASDIGTPLDLSDPLDPVPVFAIDPAPEPEAEPVSEPGPTAPPPSIAARVESIGALMARLEAGLARRAGRDAGAFDSRGVTAIRPPADEPPRDEDDDEAEDEADHGYIPIASGDPLRSALEELQRMARGR